MPKASAFILHYLISTHVQIKHHNLKTHNARRTIEFLYIDLYFKYLNTFILPSNQCFFSLFLYTLILHHLLISVNEDEDDFCLGKII